VEDGPYRARRPTGGRRRAYDDPQDVLARHGLLGPEPGPPRADEPGPFPGIESTSGRHGAVRRHRYRDDPDDPQPPGPNGHPTGGRRRAPEPFEAPFGADPAYPPPATGGRRRRADDLDAPAVSATGGTRGRFPDPADDLPPTGRRARPEQPAPDATTALPRTGGRRRAAEPDDEVAARRTAFPADAPPRRRYLDPGDEPDFPPAGFAEPTARRRARPDTPATAAPTGGRRADTGLQELPPGPPRSHRPRGPEPGGPEPRTGRPDPYRDPYDEPGLPASRRRPVEPVDASATTALRTPRRRLDHDDPDEPPATTALPTRAPSAPPGGARRRPEPTGAPIPAARSATRRWYDDPDDPVEPAATAARAPADEGRRWPPAPDPAARPTTRRRYDDPEEADGPAATRTPTAPPDEGHRRRPEPTGAGSPARTAGRRRYDDLDDPGVPAATTAIPTRPPAGPPDGGRRPWPEPTGSPAPTTRRRYDEPDDLDEPAARPTRSPAGPPDGGRRRRPEPTGRPTTRRRYDDADAPDEPAAPATTAIPTRRPVGEPADPPSRTGRRRYDDADEPPPTTALPVPGPAAAEPADDPAEPGRRRPAEPAGAAATTALPRARPAALNPEATAVVPSAARAPRTPPSDDDRPEAGEEARTRAMRIDETLTRLTAAHAGLSLAVTDRPAEEPPAPPQRRGPLTVAGRVLTGVLALVVLVATSFGWGAKTWLGSAVRDAAALDPTSSAVVDAAAQAGDENVLVVATQPAPGPDADPTRPRADTVAVAHIPEGGGPVTVLAFPLDLEINRPPCEGWDARTATYRGEPEQAEARTRLGSALDVGGPRCITRVVQQLSGLAITRYVGINLAAVPAITDAIGGAEVCVPRPVLDGVLGPVVPDPGPNRLAGVRAADFVQAGEVAGEPSADYGRIERQQQVLAAVLDSAVSGTALLDLGRLSALRPALADAVLTDEAGIDQVLALAMTLRRLDAEGVQYAAVPTGERNARGNLVMRDTDAAALFAAVRADQPLPETATDPGAGTAGPSPSEVSVEVVNASARSGLAGQVSETLSSLGFNVGEPSSADQPTTETVIRFSPDQAAAAELLRSTVPSATEVPDPGSTGVLQLVLGRSFDDVVRAPSEPIALSAPAQEAPEPAVTCT